MLIIENTEQLLKEFEQDEKGWHFLRPNKRLLLKKGIYYLDKPIRFEGHLEMIGGY